MRKLLEQKLTKANVRIIRNIAFMVTLVTLVGLNAHLISLRLADMILIPCAIIGPLGSAKPTKSWVIAQFATGLLVGFGAVKATLDDQTLLTLYAWAASEIVEGIRIWILMKSIKAN